MAQPQNTAETQLSITQPMDVDVTTFEGRTTQMMGIMAALGQHTLDMRKDIAEIRDQVSQLAKGGASAASDLSRAVQSSQYPAGLKFIARILKNSNPCTGEVLFNVLECPQTGDFYVVVIIPALIEVLNRRYRTQKSQYKISKRDDIIAAFSVLHPTSVEPSTYDLFYSKVPLKEYAGTNNRSRREALLIFTVESFQNMYRTLKGQLPSLPSNPHAVETPDYRVTTPDSSKLMKYVDDESDILEHFQQGKVLWGHPWPKEALDTRAWRSFLGADEVNHYPRGLNLPQIDDIPDTESLAVVVGDSIDGTEAERQRLEEEKQERARERAQKKREREADEVGESKKGKKGKKTKGGD